VPDPPQFDALQTEELLIHVRSGDQNAWREVYRRYRTHLATAVRRITGLLPVEADDVLQSAFLAAWKDIEGFSYRGEGSFRAWLEAIVVHKNLSRLRSLERGANRLTPNRLDTGWLEHLGDARENNPAESLLDGDEQRRLFQCMEEHLDDLAREIIVLRHLEGLSTRQVAEVVELEPEQVRRRYRSAMTKIARVLGRGQVDGT
jgi:RNA polymerase sigma-70 factor (ECF subfamily)